MLTDHLARLARLEPVWPNGALAGLLVFLAMLIVRHFNYNTKIGRPARRLRRRLR